MAADDTLPYPIGVPIEVCDLFEKIALEIKEAGWRRYSARAIVHRIRWHPRVYIMPVLQGYAISDYTRHLEMYGERLAPGAYVGVGSVCKRNTDISQIEAILSAIKIARPDLQLHGFGLKTTALSSGVVQELLFSADSMAWSFAARKSGRNPNDWREAKAFESKIETQPVQMGWMF